MSEGVLNTPGDGPHVVLHGQCLKEFFSILATRLHLSENETKTLRRMVVVAILGAPIGGRIVVLRVTSNRLGLCHEMRWTVEANWLTAALASGAYSFADSIETDEDLLAILHWNS